MNRLPALGAILLLTAWTAPLPAAETVKQETHTPNGGGGAIIEIGGGKPSPQPQQAGANTQQPATTTVNRGTAGGPGIEMIIGGQGKNGVARTGSLPVVQ